MNCKKTDTLDVVLLLFNLYSIVLPALVDLSVITKSKNYEGALVDVFNMR